MVELQTFTLPAGSVCHRNGIPFKLQHATQIKCHPDNWELIKGEPPEEQEIEATNPVRPLTPTGAVQLIPLLERLCDLLEKQFAPRSITYAYAAADEDGEKMVAAAKASANALVQQAGAMLAALHVDSPSAAFSPAEIVSMAWDRNLHKPTSSMGELQTFALPVGTALSGENIGATLRADAVVVCHPKDEYLIRAALKLPYGDQRLRTSANHSLPAGSKPCQAACFPVMSTTNSSSLESKCCANQSRTCTAVSDVSTIQVVVSLDQRVGNVERIDSPS